MKKFAVMLACIVVSLFTNAKAPEVTDVSVTGEGVGNRGRPVVVATCAAKKAAKVTDADLARCAVRTVKGKCQR